jgi:hypothetical protein
LTRVDRERQAVTAYGGPVNPGPRGVNTKIIQQVSCFEVIGGVEHQIDAFEVLFDVARVEIGHYRFVVDVRVDALKIARRGNRFELPFARVSFIEEELALQIGPLDEIAIDQAQAANASPGERRRRGGA